MSLGAYKALEPRTLGRVLKGELNRAFTVKSGTLLAGDGAARNVKLGEVLGAILLGAATGAVVAGGTGDGGIGSITLGAKAKAGDYFFTCIAEAENGGTFAVTDPDGYRLADLEVGVAYQSPQINCTISDGDADFALGDQRKITVAKGSGKLVALDPDAVDGSQFADCISAMDREAPDGEDVPINYIGFGALVNEAELVWPDGITADQKAAAVERLAARIIDLRAEA